MRTVVTGQIGMDKKPYLDRVGQVAGERGGRLSVFHLGDRMYREAPDVRPGRILDLPLSRLNSLRRAAFKDIIADTSPAEDHPPHHREHARHLSLASRPVQRLRF